MNLSQLRTFVGVVDHGSFSEAARVLGLSQPSVTMQIQALEADCGSILFDRQHHRVVLTEAGAVLLPHARAVLAEVSKARAALEKLSETVAGPVMVAASTTPGQYVLPKVLGGFLAENPGVSITLRVYDSVDVAARVEAGEADLGMTGVQLVSSRAAFEQLATDELILICPPGQATRYATALTLADLVNERFVFREPGSGTRMVAEQVMSAAGMDPGDLRVVMELGTNEAIVAAVEGGMGLAIVSAHAARLALELGRVDTIQGAGFPFERPLFLVTARRPISRAAETLADYIRTHV